MRLNDDLTTVAAMDVVVPKVTCFFKKFQALDWLLYLYSSRIDVPDFITGMMIHLY